MNNGAFLDGQSFLGGQSSSSDYKDRSRSSNHPGRSSNHPGRSSNHPGDIYNTDYAAHFTRSFGYPDERHKRKLPHRNKKELIQFITFRLADSLPQEILKQIQIEIDHLDRDRRDVEKRKKYQFYLDKGLGSCALSNQEMAQKVMDALIYHDGAKYNLLVWSIMPNHVHVLIQCITDMARIVQSWKSYTGKWGLANNKILKLSLDDDASAFWTPEYWDRFIRDEDHFNNTVRYILNNPVKAKLPKGNVAYLFTEMKLGIV